MPTFIVLKSGRFAEVPVQGNVIELDEIAAKVPLEEGAIRRADYKDLTGEDKKPEDLAGADLLEVKNMLDELMVPFWLTLGTALGAYRDGDFAPGDIDDIDLGIHIEHIGLLNMITSNMKGLGYKLSKPFTPEDGISPEYSYIKWNGPFRTKIDLWFYTPDKNKPEDTIFRFYKTTEAKEWNGKRNPTKFFTRFRKVKFYGGEYNIPFAIVKYLEMNYGEDWKTPIHRDNWDYYTSNHSPSE